MRKVHDRTYHFKTVRADGGKILFDGKDITNYSRKQMRPLRQEMQMVFQDPFSSWIRDRL